MSSFARRLKHTPSVGRLLPTYIALGVLKHIVPLPTLVRWAWRGECIPRDPEAERRVVLAVQRLRNWIGKERDCLQAGLLLYRELSRLGADPLLEVGFRHQGGRLEGHAWVVVDSQNLPEGLYERPFQVILRFGPAGALVGKQE